MSVSKTEHEALQCLEGLTEFRCNRMCNCCIRAHSHVFQCDRPLKRLSVIIGQRHLVYTGAGARHDGADCLSPDLVLSPKHTTVLYALYMRNTVLFDSAHQVLLQVSAQVAPPNQAMSRPPKACEVIMYIRPYASMYHMELTR